MSDFGDILRQLREERKLTVNQLGIYSGVSPGLVSKIENKKRGTPKPDTIEKLAKGLRMEYSDLMRMAGYVDEEFMAKEDGSAYNIGDPESKERDEFVEALLMDLSKLPEDKQKMIHELIKSMKN